MPQRDPRPAAGKVATHPTGLEELLACERELGALRSGTEVEAERIRAQARAAAKEGEANLEAALQREAAAIRASVREETRRRVREVLSVARERAAWFDALSDDDVERLAERAYRRLLALAADP